MGGKTADSEVHKHNSILRAGSWEQGCKHGLSYLYLFFKKQGQMFVQYVKYMWQQQIRQVLEGWLMFCDGWKCMVCVYMGCEMSSEKHRTYSQIVVRVKVFDGVFSLPQRPSMLYTSFIMLTLGLFWDIKIATLRGWWPTDGGGVEGLWVLAFSMPVGLLLSSCCLCVQTMNHLPRN